MATNATGTKQFCIFLFILVCVMAFLSLCSLLLAAPGSRAAYVYAGQSVSDAHAQSLHLSSSGTFQITVFEDLHYGEAEDLDWGPRQDVNSTRVMNAVLDAESSTQLVVLNGDLITGENTFLHNSTHYVDRIVEPLVARGLPWASTYGNHDSDFNLSRVGIFEREKRYTNSLTLDMVNQTNAGVSNYYLPVYGLNTSSPEFLLWFFDSRGGNYFQQTDANGDSVAQPGWVDRSVVDWFSSTNDALLEQYRRHIPSIAFVHIPINAMLAFQDQGVDPHRQPGINDDVPLAAQGESNAQGNSVSGYTYAQQDYPFMKALVGTKGLKAVFSGYVDPTPIMSGI